MKVGTLLLVVTQVCLGVALFGLGSWAVYYSRHRGWRNAMGRTLLIETVLLFAVLALSGLGVYFSIADEETAWAEAVLVGLVGPVMIWRLWVMLKLSRAVRKCPNGHTVSVAATFCPVCGALVREAD